ncbi:MAG: branched-chain amino acid ABC transporter permease, partial [Acutalibacteraceae bacterium]
LPALRLKGDYLAIVTLAFGEIVRNVFKNLDLFGGAMGLQTKTYAPTKLFIVAFIVVIIMLILVQNLIRSKHGRAVTAIRDNEIAAKAMGINVTFYKLFIFVVSAFFAGIAGTIYAHFTTPVLYTTFSYNFSIEILVMVVLGGMASINGSIIAATLITIINFVLQNKLSGDLAAIRLLVYALILIVVVIFNNAPALKGIKEKFSMKFSAKKKPKKKKGKVTDDAAEWDVIETKIKMDAVFTPDLPRSEEKNEEGGDE